MMDEQSSNIRPFKTNARFLLKPLYCMKSVRIQGFSGPYFPPFKLNTEIYSVNPRILSECRKIQTRKTAKTDNFYILPANTVYEFHLFWYTLMRLSSQKSKKITPMSFHRMPHFRE